MSTNTRETEPRPTTGTRGDPLRSELAPITRRRLLTQIGVGFAFGATGLSLGVLGAPRTALAATPAGGLPERSLLDDSDFVYISPLLASGQESSCHAELWFGWIDDSVVVTVAADRWKAKALARGLDEARIWVGNHGRWKGMLGRRNEDFLAAPNFIAKAEKVEDAGMIDRLLAVYDRKYPHEIASWRDRMRSGNADGSRIMIRYRLKATK